MTNLDLNKIKELASKLADFSPALWKEEAEKASFIKYNLEQKGISFKIQKYNVIYPVFKEYWLEADGKEIECLPSGLKSGKITQKNIIDNLSVSGTDYISQNINFNPHCSGISKPTLYPAPALSVSKADIPKILEAEKIEGKLEVEWHKYISENIIIGDTENPEAVIFTHYDSWWGGYIDNSFSVAVILDLLEDLKKEKITVVIAGSEEISQEEPYQGYGYRKFEEEYFSALKSAKEIIVIDSIGMGETEQKSSEYLYKEALALNHNFLEEFTLLEGDWEKIKTIYHSSEDTEKALNEPEKAINQVKNTLQPWIQK